ncbi:hypothetical protein MTO96_021394 [Rhipicephalus appendiculatus]
MEPCASGETKAETPRVALFRFGQAEGLRVAPNKSSLGRRDRWAQTRSQHRDKGRPSRNAHAVEPVSSPRLLQSPVQPLLYRYSVVGRKGSDSPASEGFSHRTCASPHMRNSDRVQLGVACVDRRTLYGNNGTDEAATKQAEFGVGFGRVLSWRARLSVRTSAAAAPVVASSHRRAKRVRELFSPLRRGSALQLTPEPHPGRREGGQERGPSAGSPKSIGSREPSHLSTAVAPGSSRGAWPLSAARPPPLLSSQHSSVYGFLYPVEFHRGATVCAALRADKRRPSVLDWREMDSFSRPR